METSVDFVAERFAAGVRLGEILAQDMVALQIAPDMRMTVVGLPAYFADRPPPKTPHDLAAHNCIGMRFPTYGGLAVWEFERKCHSVNVPIEGQLIINNTTLARLAALDGMRLAYLPADAVQPLIAAGDLVEVLADWCEPFPDCHLYYPSRRQPSAAFAAVMDALRYRK